MQDYVRWFDSLGMDDVAIVGGKNASLGEMVSNLAPLGINVPNGFATTAQAYREFIAQDHLDASINQILDNLDIEDIAALKAAGSNIRQSILDASLPNALEQAITTAFNQLQEQAGGNISVAVRSSATAEDLPDASFAGQQETFLNVQGIDNVLHKAKEVFASLFNDRAISYRCHQGFKHADVALSVGVQLMARSDLGSSGVMFSLDTESGFEQVVFITAAYGLGETVVQGAVNPDEFYVYKPALAAGKDAVLSRKLGSKAIKMLYGDSSEEFVKIVDVPRAQRDSFCITDKDLTELAQQAVTIEKHYGRPMDIEWAKDGSTGKIYIVQARPETVNSQKSTKIIEKYILKEKSEILVEGRSVGQRIGAGRVRKILDIDDMDQVLPGEVLLADMTDPDWEPVMKRASAIITNRGGRTCHAAIIARELGIPAIVGCGNATKVLESGQEVTVSCAQGETGYVYTGILDFEHKVDSLTQLPPLPFNIMLNVGNPSHAFARCSMPNSGIGLARLEFIINNMVGVHPQALLNYASLPDDIKQKVDAAMCGYKSPTSFYIDKITEGVATLAAAFAPNKVIVRLSDFKSNEYAHMIGGKLYEANEENPMLGFRGASRYLDPSFSECFAMECTAIKRVRNDMGLTNVEIMVPFVRTLAEAKAVIELLAQHGLERGKNGLRIIMMCELPSNALLAEQFLEYFDGFSIGSNDLTQLTLGVDRDSGVVAQSFDERNPAVKRLLQMAISAAKKANKYIGICGQGPSDHLDFAQWLADQGIDSISLNPDSVVDTWMALARDSAQAI
jgi:pyruvate, water dikinase